MRMAYFLCPRENLSAANHRCSIVAILATGGVQDRLHWPKDKRRGNVRGSSAELPISTSSNTAQAEYVGHLDGLLERFPDIVYLVVNKLALFVFLAVVGPAIAAPVVPRELSEDLEARHEGH
ncbi:hypothetical protein CVT26_005188, partial [Gymnopilus dilepis]